MPVREYRAPLRYRGEDFKSLSAALEKNRREFETWLNAYVLRLNTDGSLTLPDTEFTGSVSLGTPTTLTIATGAVTPTRSWHWVDTEAAAASDDLDTISGGEPDQLLVLQTVSNLRDVTVKDGVGNIDLQGADFTLATTSHKLVLLKVVSTWHEVTSSPPRYR